MTDTIRLETYAEPVKMGYRLRGSIDVWIGNVEAAATRLWEGYALANLLQRANRGTVQERLRGVAALLDFIEERL